MGQSKGSRKGDSNKSKREFKWERHKCTEFGLSMRGLAETRDVDKASVDLNAREIGSVLLLESKCEIRSGIGSRAAVNVIALLGVKSCKSCLDLSARKVRGKLRDVSFWYVKLRMTETRKVSMQCQRRTT